MQKERTGEHYTCAALIAMGIASPPEAAVKGSLLCMLRNVRVCAIVSAGAHTGHS